MFVYVSEGVIRYGYESCAGILEQSMGAIRTDRNMDVVPAHQSWNF
jgi:hypothetical protein